uniref:Uncharacterized protein n=1 Tax=Oryza nivara TaxID=4536 RepID=A0A0E0HHP8_ORYNI
MPMMNENSFYLWLCDSRKKVDKAHRRGSDTVATLVTKKETIECATNNSEHSPRWPRRWQPMRRFGVCPMRWCRC